jgi:thiol-disulfide isomerase/thioredoxin
MKRTFIRKLILLSLAVLFVGLPALSAFAQSGVTLSLLPVFGSGPVKVKLYADYFCKPCRGLEPSLEPLIADLVKRKIATITFVDAPFHKGSALYTKYFLMIVNERKDFEHALTARNLLFEGARQGIQEQEKLEDFLNKNGMKFKILDVQPMFKVLESYIKEDKINETPSCVIINGKKKTIHKGPTEITKALSALK